MPEASKKFSIRYEIIYRVVQTIEVTEESYTAVHGDRDDEDGTLEAQAFAAELENDEETVYDSIFTNEIESNGPDAVYILVQLLDLDGKVVKQDYIEDCDDAFAVSARLFDQNVKATAS